MKKVLSIVLVVVMLAVSMAPVFAASPKTAAFELAITEMNPNAANNLAQKWYDKFNGGEVSSTNADLYEFIEFVNTSNEDVDLRNYAIAYTTYSAVYADSAKMFGNAYVLREWFADGNKTSFETAYNAASSSYAYYSDTVKTMAGKIAAEKGVTVDEKYQVQMPTNSILKPGETAILYIMQEQDNAYCQDASDFKANFGLADDAIVIPVPFTSSTWNLSNNQIRRYAVVDMRDIPEGKYVSTAHDPGDGNPNTVSNYGEHVVSWAEVYSSNAFGETGDGKYGNGGNGRHTEIIYGFSYASDAREGLPARNSAKPSVGKLTELQKESFKATVGDYAKPDLVISGLVANTYNSKARTATAFESPTLTGTQVSAGANAFEAIELTNTSGKALNLYDYALFRSSSMNNQDIINVPIVSKMDLVPGNPVTKVEVEGGANNSAYYNWMAEKGNVNPAEMTVEAGETVIVWSYYTDSYQSGATLADFREYYGLADSVKVVIYDCNNNNEKGGNSDLKAGNLANSNTYVYGVMKKNVAADAEGFYALKDVDSYVVVNSELLYTKIDKANSKKVTLGFFTQDLRASFVYGMTSCADVRRGANVETLVLKEWKSKEKFFCTTEYGGFNLLDGTTNKLGVLNTVQNDGVKLLAAAGTVPTPPPTPDKPVETGDAASILVAVALISLAGVTVVAKKKNR